MAEGREALAWLDVQLLLNLPRCQLQPQVVSVQHVRADQQAVVMGQQRIGPATRHQHSLAWLQVQQHAALHAVQQQRASLACTRADPSAVRCQVGIARGNKCHSQMATQHAQPHGRAARVERKVGDASGRMQAEVVACRDLACDARQTQQWQQARAASPPAPGAAGGVLFVAGATTSPALAEVRAAATKGTDPGTGATPGPAEPAAPARAVVSAVAVPSTSGGAVAPAEAATGTTVLGRADTACAAGAGLLAATGNDDAGMPATGSLKQATGAAGMVCGARARTASAIGRQDRASNLHLLASRMPLRGASVSTN
eukprot:365542-Chlamydomonas_euryale.AAC.37